MDALIELQNQRTAALEEEFEADLKELRKEFEAERVYIRQKHQQVTHRSHTSHPTHAPARQLSMTPLEST